MTHYITDLDQCYTEGFKILTIESHHIEEARNHIADCQWADMDDDDIKNLTDNQIIKGISRHYSGGWPQFLADGE